LRSNAPSLDLRDLPKADFAWALIAVAVARESAPQPRRDPRDDHLGMITLGVARR